MRKTLLKLFTLLFFVVIVTFISTSANAKTSSNLDTEYDEFVDDDFFYDKNNNKYTIQDYAEACFEHLCNPNQNNIFWNIKRCESIDYERDTENRTIWSVNSPDPAHINFCVDDDNLITRIIPKCFFTTISINDTFERSGDGYGYLIETNNLKNAIYSTTNNNGRIHLDGVGDCYESTVMVYDLEYEIGGNYEGTCKGNFSFSLEPLFCQKYFTIPAHSFFSYIYNNTDDYVVIPDNSVGMDAGYISNVCVGCSSENRYFNDGSNCSGFGAEYQSTNVKIPKINNVKIPTPDADKIATGFKYFGTTANLISAITGSKVIKTIGVASVAAGYVCEFVSSINEQYNYKLEIWNEQSGPSYSERTTASSKGKVVKNGYICLADFYKEEDGVRIAPNYFFPSASIKSTDMINNKIYMEFNYASTYKTNDTGGKYTKVYEYPTKYTVAWSFDIYIKNGNKYEKKTVSNSKSFNDPFTEELEEGFISKEVKTAFRANTTKQFVFKSQINDFYSITTQNELLFTVSELYSSSTEPLLTSDTSQKGKGVFRVSEGKFYVIVFYPCETDTKISFKLSQCPFSSDEKKIDLGEYVGQYYSCNYMQKYTINIKKTGTYVFETSSNKDTFLILFAKFKQKVGK